MTTTLRLPPIPSGARVDDLVGVWAIEPQQASQLAQLAPNYDFAAHFKANQEPAAAAAAETLEAGSSSGDVTIAVVRVEGVMSKHGSSFARGGATVPARRELRAAVNDRTVDGIVVVFDTPGGIVGGTEALANDIAAAAKQKPLRAYCDDLCCSAGYWCASQAGAISANSTAMVGSIGVFSYVYDMSKKAEDEGVQTFVFRTGPIKGAGVPGDEFTDEQARAFQARVDAYFDHFLTAVETGRGFDAAKSRASATGDVWIAGEAKERGLIDHIQSFDECVADLATACLQRRRGSTMSKTSATTTPKSDPAADDGEKTGEVADKPAAATVEQIEAACPNAPAAFVLEQFKKQASVSDAQSAYIAAQNDRISQLEKAESDRATSDKTPASDKTPVAGNDPVSTDAADDSGDMSAREKFESLVDEQVAKGKTKPAAVAHVKSKNADLYRAMVEEANRA